MSMDRIGTPLRSLAMLWLLAALAVALTTSCATRGDLVEQARSGTYSAEGLYEPRIMRYDNGLTLITKRRAGARSVSVRVKIGLGMAHYECGQQHVPHFLEHMLFASVPGLSEAELEREFFEIGAWTNAYTGTLRTVYEADMFSGTAMDGLDLMADMLTRAELERESFENTREVIWREMGGEPGPVEAQSLPGGPLASGVTEYASDVSARYLDGCPEFDGGQSVEFESVQQAYANYYLANRMTWVVVGDFDEDALLDWAENRLATLPQGDVALPKVPGPSVAEKSLYTGLAWEPGVILVARTKNDNQHDFYARSFISHLLDEQLYERLRLDTALTYTPQSFVWSWSDWGLFGIIVESSEEDHDQALQIIREIVGRLKDRPLDEKEFRIVKLSLLRQWAQSAETNEDYAEHYVSRLSEIEDDRAFTHDEVELAALTSEQVHDLARRMFAPENIVIIRDGDRQARIDARDDDFP